MAVADRPTLDYNRLLPWKNADSMRVEPFCVTCWQAARSVTPAASIMSRSHTGGALRDPRLPSVTLSASIHKPRSSDCIRADAEGCRRW